MVADVLRGFHFTARCARGADPVGLGLPYPRERPGAVEEGGASPGARVRRRWGVTALRGRELGSKKKDGAEFGNLDPHPTLEDSRRPLPDRERQSAEARQLRALTSWRLSDTIAVQFHRFTNERSDRFNPWRRNRAGSRRGPAYFDGSIDRR